MHTPAARAAIYTRVSLDRDGTSKSPDQQEAECRAEAERHGWQVTEVYSDRNVSAFKRGATRPAYERLLHDLEAGAFDVLLVWELTRLTRGGLTGIAPVVELLQKANAQLVSVTQPIDTTTTEGEMMLGFLAGMAKKESENTSKRVKRAHRDAVKNGKMHTGGNRQYGYTREGEIEPTEAAVIRECVARVLAGESLRAIARDLNTRGIKTSTAGKTRKLRGKDEFYVVRGEWRSVTLSQVLRSPTLAGIRVHHGDVHEQGNWEPILTVDEHREVLRVLASRRSDQTAEVRSHLLSGAGVIRCGLCGQAMRRMSFRMRNGRIFHRYQCLRQQGQDQCGHVAITQASTDAFVTDELLYFLTVAEVRPLEGEESETDLEAQLVEARTSLGELDIRRYVKRTLDQARYERLSGPLEVEIASLEARLGALRRAREERATQIPLGDRAALDLWWDKATPEERIAAVRQAIRTVTIHPARRRGGNQFDDKRVDIDWRYDLFREIRHTPDREPAGRSRREITAR